MGYGRLGKRSPLSVICSAGGYTAPIVFEDDVYGLVFSAARASESFRNVDYEVVVDFAVINNRRRGAGRPHTLGYGRLRIGNLDRAGQRDDDEHAPLGSRDVAYVVAHLLDGHVSEALNVREHRVLRVHGKPWGAVARREREEAPMAPSSVERDPGLGRLHHEFLGTGKRRLGYGMLAAIERLTQ